MRCGCIILYVVISSAIEEGVGILQSMSFELTSIPVGLSLEIKHIIMVHFISRSYTAHSVHLSNVIVILLSTVGYTSV